MKQRQTNGPTVSWKILASAFAVLVCGNALWYAEQRYQPPSSLEIAYAPTDDPGIIGPPEIGDFSAPITVFPPEDDITGSVLGASSIKTFLNNFSTGYDVKPIKQAKGTVRIPVLMYHHIAPMPKNRGYWAYYVTPQIFQAQMAYLKAKGYLALTPQQFYDQLMSGQNPKQKMVMITFDDGNQDNYKYAYPILKKYNLTGVFYVITKHLGITVKQLQEMSRNGMIIASHTETHPDLRTVKNKTKLANEISRSKQTIQAITGQTDISIAYPGCTYNDAVVKMAIAAGYKFGVSCGSAIDQQAKYRFALSRNHVYNNYHNFIRILSGYTAQP